jgi:putative MATE family efflux protein
VIRNRAQFIAHFFRDRHVVILPDSAPPDSAMAELSDSVTPPSTALKRGVLADVREALRGSQQDFTEGPIGRAILLLAVPMVLEMALESVFAVTDVFFVSRLGAEAVATVGLTESMLTLVYAMAMGLGIGATAVVARRIGERDRNGAAHAAVQALVLGLITAVVLGVFGVLFAPELLGAMGASSGVVSIGANYTRVMLGGEATVVVLFVVNAVFRGAGDAAIAMRVLWLANTINILLGPCLIFGLGPFPRLGVVGAATATTIGRGVGAAFAVSQLFRHGSRVSVTRRELRVDPRAMLQIARLSASGVVQSLVGMASWIGLVRLIATFGDAALAGYTIGIRLVVFALLPSWGMSNAAATMVGQALGARKPERAERAVWQACFYNACFLAVIGTLFVVFASPVVRAFSSDPDVLRYGVACLRIVSAGFLFYAYGMVLTQSFNGAGDTNTPTLINLGVFWLFEIPLAWVVARWLGLGALGVFVAIAIAFSTLAVVSAIIFRRGAWKTRRV